MNNRDITSHKFVAVLNKKVDPGKAMNALAHMSVGLMVGTSAEEMQDMAFSDYIDKDGGRHPNLSKNSYVILRAENSNQLRTLRQQALEAGVRCTDFTDSMQEGTYLEQIERVKNIPEAELNYVGVCLFGPIETLNGLTRKFQLWK